MKKIVYTFSLVLFAAMVSKAQNTQEPEKKSVQPISVGTVDMEQASKQNSNTDLKKPAKSSDASEKGNIQPTAPKSTRMAINEKGVPASKDTKTTTASPAKEQKSSNPGQPTTDNK